MKKFGIIGYPLGHSFSPGYFNEKFQNEKIDAVYEKYELPVITDLQAVLDYTPELCGFNVTIPYKEPRMRLKGSLDQIIDHPGYDRKHVIIGVESKVFGIGVASTTPGTVRTCRR